MLDLKTIQWSRLDPFDQERLLQRPVFRNPDLGNSVAGILKRVQEGGDSALTQLTLELDGVAPEMFESGISELDEALSNTERDLHEALSDAASRIREFHSADIPRDNSVETAPGLTCEVRYQALSPVGLYVPGGSAPLVSTVLMLAIPAVLAGCEEIVMCSPPGKDGRVPNEILAAARLCGPAR